MDNGSTLLVIYLDWTILFIDCTKSRTKTNYMQLNNV